MKSIFALFIIFNLSMSFNLESITQLQQLNDKKQCVPILIFTAFNGYKLYQFIQQKQNDNAFFQALDVIKCLYMDYKCFKQSEVEDEKILDQIEDLKRQVNFTQNRQECIDQKMSVAVQDIQQAVEDLIQKDFNSFMKHIKEAIQKFKEAKEC